MKIFEQTDSYKERIAIESNNEQFTYGYLIERSNLIASFMLNNKEDLMEEKIGLLMNPNIDYICTLWGIWKAGGVAVPLSLSAKKDELKHYISDCDIKLIISSDSYEKQHVIPKFNDLTTSALQWFHPLPLTPWSDKE